MIGNPTPDNVDVDASERIARDVLCVHCGYNVRSLLPGQTCPECNQPVHDSLRRDLLQFSDPTWLARLSSGMWWLILACILRFTSKLALPFLITWLRTLGHSPLVAFRACDVSIHLAELVAIWRLTVPQPRLSDAQQPDTRRKLARLLLTTAISVGLLKTVLDIFPAGWIWLFSLRSLLHITSILPIIESTVSVAGWILLYVYLVRLAHRLPSPNLARLTWATCVVTTLSSVVWLILAIWTLWANAVANEQTATNFLAIVAWVSTLSFVGSMVLDLLLAIMAGIYRHRLRKTLRVLGAY